MPPPKPKPAAVAVGPYCDRCDRPIVGPAIPIGLRDRCVACLLRPNVLVNHAIRRSLERARDAGRGGCEMP